MKLTGKGKVVLSLVVAAVVLVGFLAYLTVASHGEEGTEPANPAHRALVQWQGSLTELGHECDTAYEDLERTLGAVPDRKMELAIEARRACAVAAYEVGQLPVPAGLPGGLGQQVRQTRKICQDFFTAKERSAHAQIAIIDRDLSLDAYREARETSEALENNRLSCEISLDAMIERTATPAR